MFWNSGQEIPSDLISKLLLKYNGVIQSNEKHSAVKETYFDSLDEDFSCDRHPVEGKRLRIKDSNKIKKSQSSYSQKREKFLSSFFSFLSMKKSSLPLTEKKDISLKGSSQSSKDKDQYARFFDENRKPNIMLNLEPLSLKNPEPIIRSLFNAGPDNQDCFCIRNSSPFNMIAFISRGSEYWAVKPMRTVVLPKNSRKRIHMENEKVVYLTVYRQLEDGRYLLIRDIRPLEIGSEWVGTEEIMTAGIEIVHRLQDTSNHAKVNDSNTFVGLVNYLIIRVHKNADALIQVDLIRNALYIAVLACIGYSIGFLIDKCIQ